MARLLKSTNDFWVQELTPRREVTPLSRCALERLLRRCRRYCHVSGSVGSLPTGGRRAGQRAQALLVGRQLGRRTLVYDTSVVQHVGDISDSHGGADILLDQQNRHAFLAQRDYNLEYLLHDLGRQALRGFIKQQNLGV